MTSSTQSEPLAAPGASNVLTLEQGNALMIPGIWAIHPRTLGEIVAEMRSPARGNSAPTLSPVHSSGSTRIAVIQMRGPMAKRARLSWLMDDSRFVWTPGVRQEIERAAYDDAVGAILLVIDSGGGTVAGTDDLWLTLRDATRRKPCWVFCEDITASAAYYVATAAHRVISNASCEIGSLGTIYVFADTSELLSRAGVRVVVIATGPLKGVGCPGTALTEEGRAELQREADFHGRQFMSRVAEGRGWSMIRTKELFTGRIWHAKEALQHGLIDAVGTLRGTIAELRRELIAQSPPPALRSATLGELRAALPQATAEFRETCLVEMLNLEECRERFAALPPVDPLVPCRRPSRQRGPAFGSAWTDVRT